MLESTAMDLLISISLAAGSVIHNGIVKVLPGALCRVI